MIDKDFSSLLRNLQCSEQNKWPAVLKGIAEAINSATSGDILQLLELLTSTHDINIQIKLMSVLSSYLISNGLYYELIVKYSPLYETVQNLLTRGLPLKAATVLNYILALLSADEEDPRRSLVQYAQNTIRVSGCLSTMSHMFIDSMMYQDTWVALCRSLAESCRNSEVNQHYCSHLVPLCIQRCRSGNADVCSVLQSLLQNNSNNIKLFLDNDGLTIFTRQLLQYNMCIQLLYTIVQKSPQAVIMLKQTNVIHHLRDFLRLYGPHSQLGQWSSIVLFHFDARNKSGKIAIDDNGQVGAEDVMSTGNKTRKRAPEFNYTFGTELKRTNFIPMAKPNFNFNINAKLNSKIINTNKLNHKVQSKETLVSRNNDPDDTMNLFKNVINEVIHWRAKTGPSFKRNVKVTPASNRRNARIKRVARLTNNCSKIQGNQVELNAEKIKQQNPTLSFLRQEPKVTSYECDDKQSGSFVSKITCTQNNATTMDKGIQTETSMYTSGHYRELSFMDLSNFQPPFISTPKRQRAQHKQNQSKVLNTSRIHKKQPSKRRSYLNTSQSPIKEIKNRSMSARFFSAINESCTTFVKSVKSIFKTNQNKINNNKESMNKDDGKIKNASCRYSFTNYMRKRDNLTENKRSDTDNSSSGIYNIDSCKTCKDTIILQEKLVTDDQLKRTVKKLKHGLNVYGFDFKKICKTMWSQDRYMTPGILYDLYRKLIKGSHDDHECRHRNLSELKKRESSISFSYLNNKLHI